ncbi:shufflon system plasmid conjugative transfer pilus tip adhesin PilV [Burkholderia sp. FERM BP-3421]|uniref:PulJ/GspJ family protein n=1 Tax=Burkholderia sp. FERM BP-3421 TaxID=1494466 RepID=UPI0023616E31|nr:shufflon system plasmid conjugative transfer pilus tip adhesin PilV [Burkholderia sp. FERM BP-3421]WDD92554.1 shufflon system plasmid conjugative transfer pilus tip adhesin PilV [Burkholderia sp. FERM BP-3421]
MRYGMMRRRARGFTLIEVLGALAVAAMMLIGIAAMMDTSIDDVRAQQAAKYQEQVTGAVTRALKRDYDAWMQKAGTQTPVVMPFADLQTNGDLPQSLQLKNAFGQSTCVLVKKSANGKGLDALVVTTGGEAIRDVDLGPIAAGSGAGGGSIAASNPAEARGAYGNWIINLATYLGGGTPGCGRPGPGHLANEIFFNGPGQQINSDYLYRVGVGGHPEANAMQVPIWLSGTIQLDRADPANCGTASGFMNGKIAADLNGNVASCRNGYWRGAGGHWKEPVASASQLPNDASNERGDVRLTLDFYRAYSWTGAGWQALAVDQKGNLIVPGIIAANMLEITGQVVVNTSCSPDPDPARKNAGQVSMGADGQLLTCQDGKWLPQSGIKIGSTDKSCSILMVTYGASDFSCPDVFTGPYTSPYVSHSEDGTYTYVIERPVTLNNNGLISVSAYMHMAYALCNKTGRQGQMRLIVQIVDKRNNAVIASNEAQSTKLIDDSSTINVTLNQAAEPGNGYKVVLSSNWATYDQDATPWQSTYCNSKRTFLQTPLVTGWTINSFY